jgi:hypothetical protein
MKTMSGSSRDKTQATPKQNKWNNPFYCESHRASRVTNLYNHKVDSIRASVSGETKSMFKSMLTAVSSFFNRVFRRKVIA